MAFKNRWRIDGTLTTRTSLHIGNGDITSRDDLVDESAARDPKPKVDISAVATHQGCAYIPGTTLKGNLRAWLRMSNVSLDAIDAVFGSDNPGTPASVGGKAEFWDAFATGVPDPPPQVPYWNCDRLTGVFASVAIDRRTRTARLFHTECVPPGISFAMTITGQDLEVEKEELALLLFALEGFNDPENPVTLGANTGDGQGCFTWKLTDIARLGREDVAAWLQQKNHAVGYDSLVALADADRDAMVAHALSIFRVACHPTITLSLAIHFDGPFLVNDPSRTRRRGTQRPSEDDKLPHHAPRRDHQDRVVLPARSLRGAIRSQAEKIVRTWQADAACRAVDPKSACEPIYEDSQRDTHLCLTCQVFGASGWRAPVEFSDFCSAGRSTETCFKQEFLAIDRFTGGGADRLKFNAVAVYRPTLTGTMSVHLHRVEPWALGLLALTLRDLMEGDIPLGFGAAKGYGACRAAIIRMQVSGLALPALQAILQASEATQVDFNSPDIISKPPLEEVEFVVMGLVEAFQMKVKAFQRHVPRPGGQDVVL
jgi:CRISPR/Cas system CSM-associated protein Csm3 (group 7 of RAMP superfamily)